MKSRHHIARLMVLTFVLFALLGCVSSVSPTPNLPTSTAVPTKLTSMKVSASITPTSTSVFPTPQITREVITLASNPEQVTDGKLKLSIKEDKHGDCYVPGTHISLILTYENLTDQPLKILDYNIISSHVLARSYGQLSPVLTTVQSIRLISREDAMTIELINPNPNTLIQILPPQSRFNVDSKYYLSTEFAAADNWDDDFRSIPAGQYYLKLMYSSIGYQDSWKGSISSNRIEFCVGN